MPSISTGPTQKDGEQILAAVVRLLTRAGDRACDAATPGPHPGAAALAHPGAAALALGAQLAASQALGLLGEDAQVDEPVPAQADPLRLLRAAEELTRTLPIEAYPPGTCQVIAAICDLIREHGA